MDVKTREQLEGLNLSSNEGVKEQNKLKNRYALVLPYDQTRVKLTKIPEVACSDYLNANYISGPRKKMYIATQGPLPNTFNDFWRLVWEVNVNLIIMLTLEIENGRIKCHRYWPEMEEANEELKLIYGDFKVVPISKVENGEITTRIFNLSKIKKDPPPDQYDEEKGIEEVREIVHCQYVGWPDHGVPDHTEGIRELVKTVQKNRKRKNPIVVHCSAGIGRTGTFCTIDITLAAITKHIKENSVDPFKFEIWKTVLDLRRQRDGMVQQPEQYRFCYEVIMEGAEDKGMEFVNGSNRIKPKEDRKKKKLSLQKMEVTPPSPLLKGKEEIAPISGSPRTHLDPKEVEREQRVLSEPLHHKDLTFAD